jgi:hypothetical protein
VKQQLPLGQLNKVEQLLLSVMRRAAPPRHLEQQMLFLTAVLRAACGDAAALSVAARECAARCVATREDLATLRMVRKSVPWLERLKGNAGGGCSRRHKKALA